MLNNYPIFGKTILFFDESFALNIEIVKFIFIAVVVIATVWCRI
jgi:hypothetical protein